MSRVDHVLYLEGPINPEGEQVDMVIFIGKDAKKRSKQYEKWKKEHKNG